MTRRLREYRPPTLSLEPGGCIELGTVQVYKLAACNIVACTLVNAAYHDEEERRSHSSGEGFTVGAAAATVARRTRLTSELAIMIEVIDRRSNGLIGYTYLGSIHVKRPDHFAANATRHASAKEAEAAKLATREPRGCSNESNPLFLFSAPGSARCRITGCDSSHVAVEISTHR
ncbi:hypothetical protein JB92DRAFT_2832496 [Gautieria morchelliformis]|nr:hypothetical protein JB92DRAFT_2832496 [Gautieria morchelliformis]